MTKSCMRKSKKTWKRVKKILFCCVIRRKCVEDKVSKFSQYEEIDNCSDEKCLFYNLKESVFKITQFLEKIEESFTNNTDSIFNFNVNISEDSYIQCQTLPEKKRLKISSCDNSSLLRRCQDSYMLKTHTDRSIQCYDDRKNQKSPLTLPKIIDNSLLHLTNFQLTKLKLNMLDHMQGMRNDVAAMKKLVDMIDFAVKSTENKGLKRSFKTERDSILATEEMKFLEAELRAKNFCRFYKLRCNRSSRSILFSDSSTSKITL